VASRNTSLKLGIMTKQLAWPLFGILLLTSCATPRQPESAKSRFNEENNADIVIRHYSDEVNRVLKPLQMQGPFLSTFDKGGILDLATQQSGHELAVVILLKSNTSDNVKQDWVKILKEAGYKRIVFLRADTPGLRINGLPVLDSIGGKAT
jgi:hypothetical protein